MGEWENGRVGEDSDLPFSHSPILPFVLSSTRRRERMGVYFDLGRPVIGGWMGGGWVTHDPLREVDLLWGAEFGQEGAVLFAIDVETGEVVERHRIGAREFSAIPREETGELWIYTYHG